MLNPIKYFSHSIKFKIKAKLLLLIILAEIISSGVLFLGSYVVYTKSIENKTINYNMTEINNINKNIDLYFNKMEYIAYTLAYNPVVQNYLTFHNINSEEENNKQGNEILNSISILSIVNSPLQITIFSADNSNLFFSSGYSSKMGYNYRTDEWYNIIRKSEEDKSIMINNPQPYLYSNARKSVYTLVYKCKAFGSHKILGYILMDIEKSTLEQFFKTENIDIESTLISDNNNKLLYESDTSNFQLNLSTFIPKNQDQGYMTKSINGSKYLMVFGTSKFTNWKIIDLIPYNSLFKDIRLIKYIDFGIFLILLLLTIYITYKFTDIITKPIEKLKNGMHQVMNGNFNSSIEELSSQDEIGELIEYFNKMIYEIQFLIKDAESSKYLKKDAQLKSLQQQINPHFLYNTLEMIIGLSGGSNENKIKTICKSLGYMFRYNLNSKKIVTIEEELEQIKRYIYIMEERFEGRFKASYEIDETLLQNKTLKFFLQPLVENSISYGFSDMVSGGNIIIRIQRLDAAVEFNIIDNGEGFSPEKLFEINNRLQASIDNPYEYMETSDHIGIMNVHMRFLILFKEDYSIQISSIQKEETCIKIVMPII